MPGEEITLREFEQLQNGLKEVKDALGQHLIGEALHQGEQKAHWDTMNSNFGKVLEGIEDMKSRQDKTNGNVVKNDKRIDSLEKIESSRVGKAQMRAAIIAGLITTVGFVGTLLAITHQVKTLLSGIAGG